jgi:hypothetical protein
MDKNFPSVSRTDMQTVQGRLLAILGPVGQFRENLSNGRTYSLLQEFEAFALNYIYYIVSTPPADNLARDTKSALDNLLQEWVTISRVCEQRQVMEFGAPLLEADKLADLYYSRFKGFKAKAEPITYFGKVYGISRFVSVTHPLISIPLYVFNIPEQWEQGLAHEIGHYIYWNSVEFAEVDQVHRYLRNIILRALSVPTQEYDVFVIRSRLVDIWISWIEELVADVCGALLIGPAYVSSAIDLAEERAFKDETLAFDDGVHPCPYLRPLIGLETLTWIQSRIQKDAKWQVLQQNISGLQAQWEARLKPDRIDSVVHNISGLHMSQLRETVSVVVHALLGGDVGNGVPYPYLTWTKNGQSAKVEDLVPLGDLIEYQAWLDELAPLDEEMVRQRARQGPVMESMKKSKTMFREPNEKPPTSEIFDRLLQQIKERLKRDTENRDIENNDRELKDELLSIGGEWRGNTDPGCGVRSFKLKHYSGKLWERCS